MGTISLYIDGASRGNPGPAGIGAVLLGPDNEVVAELAQYIGETTNNVAEYRALLEGLQEASRRGIKALHIFSDSQLLVRQINGEYRVKHPNLIPLYQEAKKALSSFASSQVTHVPREKNKRADQLANQGIEAARG